MAWQVVLMITDESEAIIRIMEKRLRDEWLDPPDGSVTVEVRRVAEDEPVVTTTMFTPAEQAAWRVAVDRELLIEAADLRAMFDAASPVAETRHSDTGAGSADG